MIRPETREARPDAGPPGPHQEVAGPSTRSGQVAGSHQPEVRASTPSTSSGQAGSAQVVSSQGKPSHSSPSIRQGGLRTGGWEETHPQEALDRKWGQAPFPFLFLSACPAINRPLGPLLFVRAFFHGLAPVANMKSRMRATQHEPRLDHRRLRPHHNTNLHTIIYTTKTQKRVAHRHFQG